MTVPAGGRRLAVRGRSPLFRAARHAGARCTHNRGYTPFPGSLRPAAHGVVCRAAKGASRLTRDLSPESDMKRKQIKSTAVVISRTTRRYLSLLSPSLTPEIRKRKQRGRPSDCSTVAVTAHVRGAVQRRATPCRCASLQGGRGGEARVRHATQPQNERNKTTVLPDTTTPFH